MPKLEPRVVQKELEQGQLWPVYWLYGEERMKARELLKRIRKAALGEESAGGAGFAALGFSEETFDGGETDAAAILEAAQSPSLGGGLRFLVIRDAHLIRNSEQMAGLLGARAKAADLVSVCVFLSKDLDGRKKFSKLLSEKAAVVPCETVPESERESWIQYLAKRKGLVLEPALAAQLVLLEPWTLDIIDQELEKFSLAQGSGDVLLSGSAVLGGVAEAFLQAFFARNLREALVAAERFADQPDEALPLLGLLAWNARQLAVMTADRESGARGSQKLNPYAAEKLARWSRGWSLADLITLQSELAELDHSFKQKPLLPLGLWDSLVTRFCR